MQQFPARDRTAYKKEVPPKCTNKSRANLCIQSCRVPLLFLSWRQEAITKKYPSYFYVHWRWKRNIMDNKLENQIHQLYKRFPELVSNNRLLEFIMLTLYDNLDYVMQHPYHELKYLLSDQRLNLNAYLDAPALESITRAARKVREQLRKVQTLDAKIEKARLEKEIEYRQKYSPQMKIRF